MENCHIRRVSSSRSNLWTSVNGADAFSMSSREDEDDEKALKWAVLEKVPTYNRLRRGIFTQEEGITTEIDIQNLGKIEKRTILERLVKIAEEDNEKFLFKLQKRMDGVGVRLPTIEVRFENFKVDGESRTSGRALPTIFNFTVNILEVFLNCLPIMSKKSKFTILHGLSGIVKPGRMTLLLGPPSSGKTTLLLALAGKLDKDLKVSGNVTYNGHEMKEFIPERTSAYISQYDLHMGELTVRETLAFSARVQGVGPRYETLKELLRKEKEANIMIKPGPDIDIFMKAISLEGQEANVLTDYILKILGLEVCADSLVGDEMIRGISGGQRKRLTTGTAVISLLQPTPETYELFDDIILLSDGHIVYQGPLENILDFFQSMGFKCPERKGVADFLQEVTSKKDQEQYWARKEEPYNLVSAKEFSEAFKCFHVGQKLGDELAVPIDSNKGHPAALTTKKYGVSKRELLRACLDREYVLMKRNAFVSSAFWTLWSLFSRAIIPKPRIPGWWKWYYYMCPISWTLNGLVASQFGGISEPFQDTGIPVERHRNTVSSENTLDIIEMIWHM